MTACPACEDREKKAEEISQMIQTFQMMSAKSEEDRKKILNARMNGFLTMPDDKRVDAMTDMFDTIEDLTPNQRNTIVKTRTDLLTSMPKDDRNKIMGSAKEIFSTWEPDRKMMEKEAIMYATDDYMLLKRMMVRRMFKKMLA
ncbi:MAG: hypothetical protein KAS77_00905 [Thermoplasmata archaeon]|nr:hypothetical protein [Thermoplasmata archaeon]